MLADSLSLRYRHPPQVLIAQKLQNREDVAAHQVPALGDTTRNDRHWSQGTLDQDRPSANRPWPLPRVPATYLNLLRPVWLIRLGQPLLQFAAWIWLLPVVHESSGDLPLRKPENLFAEQR